jgi:ferritin-like metal-binding protein YciE
MARNLKSRSTSKNKNSSESSSQSRTSNVTSSSHSKGKRNIKRSSKRASPQTKRVSLNDKLGLYLNEVLSMENASIQRLQSRIKQTRLQDAKQQLQLHLNETKEQQKRLRQLISNLGGKPTNDKAQLPLLFPARSLMNTLKRHMTSAEIDLKGTKEDAVVENAEIVFYDMLTHILQKANVDGEAVSVLTQSLYEEKSMAEWIRSNTPIMLTQLWPDIEASVTKQEIDK